MKTLLTDIQTRLLEKAPSFKYIDEDWGQLDIFNPPVKWPCTLIDTTNSSWSNVLHDVQLGLVQVKIKVADVKISNSSGAAPQGQKNRAFAFQDLLKEIFTALHGWSGHKHYSKLIRTNITKIRRDDGVRLHEITFTTELTDNSAEKLPTKFVLQPNQIV